MTWDELRGEAFVEIGLKPDEFYDMERDDYINIYKKGYRKKLILYYRMLRWAVRPLNKVSIKDFNEFIHMPIDDDNELKQIQKEQDAASLEKTLQILEMHRKGGFKYVKEGNRIIMQKENEN